MGIFNLFRKTPGIGIDFGTYKSAISFTIPDGKDTKLVELPFVFDNRKFKSFSIPTRVSLKNVEKNKYDIRLAGWHTGAEKISHIRRFKLEIGKGWKKNGTPISGKQISSNEEITIEGLTARLFRFLSNKATDTAQADGRNISNTKWVISVPSTWEYHQRRATLFAAKAAYLKNASVIDEPIAAAIYLSKILKMDFPSNGYTLVIDIGAGTTDFALIESRAGKIMVKLSESVTFGGNNIDDALYKFLKERSEQEKKPLIDPESFSELPIDLKAEFLLEYIRVRKEEINNHLITQNGNDDPFLDDLRYKGWARRVPANVSITPEDFIQITDKQMSELQMLIRDFLQSRLDDTDRIETVILVGGGSKIYSSKAKIEEAFQMHNNQNRSPEVQETTKDPEWAVTKGASYYSWLLANNPGAIRLISTQAIGITLPNDIEIQSGKPFLKADSRNPIELPASGYVLIKTKKEFSELKLNVWCNAENEVVDTIIVKANKQGVKINIPNETIIGFRFEIKQDKLIHFDKPYGAVQKEKLDFSIEHSVFPYEDQKQGVPAQIANLRKSHELI